MKHTSFAFIQELYFSPQTKCKYTSKSAICAHNAEFLVKLNKTMVTYFSKVAFKTSNYFCVCVSDYFLDGQLSRRLTFGWRQFPPAYLSYQATMKGWNNSSKVSRYIFIFCRKSVHIVCCPYFSVFPLTWTSCQTLVCHIKENFLQTLKKIFFSYYFVHSDLILTV